MRIELKTVNDLNISPPSAHAFPSSKTAGARKKPTGAAKPPESGHCGLMRGEWWPPGRGKRLIGWTRVARVFESVFRRVPGAVSGIVYPSKCTESKAMQQMGTDAERGQQVNLTRPGESIGRNPTRQSRRSIECSESGAFCNVSVEETVGHGPTAARLRKPCRAVRHPCRVARARLMTGTHAAILLLCLTYPSKCTIPSVWRERHSRWLLRR